MKITKPDRVLFLPNFIEFFLWLSQRFLKALVSNQKTKLTSIMTTNIGDE
jgi:hypothetical protein